MTFQQHVCSFCWLFIECYPLLKGIPEKDGQLYRLHLMHEHGWKEGISV